MKKVIILTIVLSIFCGINTQAKLILKESNFHHTLSVTQDRSGTKVKWDKKTIRWYDFNGKIKIIPEGKLTYRMLRSRRNKFLYIEKITGKIINNKFDGKTKAGNYISYKKLKGKAKTGDIIITYCIYNPYTRWIDDIDERYDIIVR